ncbi:hypothetical protein A4G19_08935 [Pasteurellaceae bacterium Macca]|nr:hypothetical protein [Pasteurellaceae bacterium Macca]
MLPNINHYDSLVLAYSEAFIHSLPSELIFPRLHYYYPEWGDVRFLENVRQESLHYLYISAEINDELFNEQRIKEALASWFSVVIKEGMMIVSRQSVINVEHFSHFYHEYIEIFNDPLCAYFIVRKKQDLPDIPTLVQQCYSLFYQNQLTESFALLDHCYMLDCRDLVPYLLRSVLLKACDQLREDDYWWHLAMRHNHNHIQAQIYYALNLLQQGRYYWGFATRELALSNLPHFVRCHDLMPPKERRWNGQMLFGKKLIVWSEFGLGDEIMFSQLAYFLKREMQVEHLIYFVQSPLKTLMDTHPDIDEVWDIKSVDLNQLPKHDYWVYPHAILAHIPVEFKDMPKRYPYLFVNADKRSYFLRKMQTQSTGYKVGFVFRGSPTHENDSNRSVHEISYIEKLFQQFPQIDWYCLQKELSEEEQQLLKRYHIPYFSDELHDMSDTAAILMNLDLFISVDTSVIHLAGALGVQSIVLIPFINDWRWGYQGTTNLWYPNVQVLRQGTKPDWDYVFTQLSQALAKWVNQ